MDNNLQGDGDKTKVKAEDKVESGRSLYAEVDADRAESLQIAQAQGKTTAIPQRFQPTGFSVIPPHLLKEMVNRNPSDPELVKTLNKTTDLQETPIIVRPRVDTGANGDREVYDAQGKEVQPGVKVRFEGEKPTGETEADNAYDYTGLVRDFFKKEFGRNSIDGQGMKFISTVNYGENYENAFWDGSQMTYGRPGPDSPFKSFVILDVVGHEIMHGVTERESNMRYWGQSGALNESMSDVFGELIEQWSKKQTADQADWVIGNGIWKDTVKGRGLRDMLNPGTAYDDPAVGKDPQPAHMKDYWNGWGDNGGVHYNSGIPNRAFATFAKAVGGNAWEAPGHIWYNALKAAGSNPDFASFAHHTVEAAKAMGRADLVQKLEAAWDGVGVKPQAPKATDSNTTPGGSQDQDHDHKHDPDHDHKHDHDHRKGPLPQPGLKKSA